MLLQCPGLLLTIGTPHVRPSTIFNEPITWCRAINSLPPPSPNNHNTFVINSWGRNGIIFQPLLNSPYGFDVAYLLATFRRYYYTMKYFGKKKKKWKTKNSWEQLIVQSGFYERHFWISKLLLVIILLQLQKAFEKKIWNLQDLVWAAPATFTDKLFRHRRVQSLRSWIRSRNRNIEALYQVAGKWSLASPRSKLRDGFAWGWSIRSLLFFPPLTFRSDVLGRLNKFFFSQGFRTICFLAT